LGVWLHEKLSNKEHITKRIDNFRKGLYAVGGTGIASNRLTATIKAFIIKTYCIPILLYGIEPIRVTWSDIQLLKRTFTVALKRCLIMNKFLKTEDLCYACNMEPVPIEIIKRKLNFYIQLNNNALTRRIIEQLILHNKIGEKSFISEIQNILNDNPNPNELTTKVRQTLMHMELVKREKLNSKIVIDIKFYISNPSVVNWRKLNELLIPDSIRDRQDEYWSNLENGSDMYIENEFNNIRYELINNNLESRNTAINTFLQM
jgi:hypothetical protein